MATTTNVKTKTTPKVKVESNLKDLNERAEALAIKAAGKTADILEETSDTLEKALDVTEKHLDNLTVGNNKFRTWVKRGPWAVVAISAASFAIGAGVGFYVARKRLGTKYEQMLADELEVAKQFYGKLYKSDSENASPGDVVDRIHGSEARSALTEYQGLDVPEAEVLEQKTVTKKKTKQGKVVTEQTIISVDDETNSSGFDYQKEIPLRTPDAPYIITEEEFNEGPNDKDYEQSALTYFMGDNVLMDERDEVIPNVEGIVGQQHLARFGEGTTDPNMVYVRNDKLEMDFEISRTNSKYSHDILGFDDEAEQAVIKHSAMSTMPQHRVEQIVANTPPFNAPQRGERRRANKKGRRR